MRPGRVGDDEHVGGAKGVKERVPARLKVRLEGVAVWSGLVGAAARRQNAPAKEERRAYEAVVLVNHDTGDPIGLECSPVEAGDVCGERRVSLDAGSGEGARAHLGRRGVG